MYIYLIYGICICVSQMPPIAQRGGGGKWQAQTGGHGPGSIFGGGLFFSF